MIERKTLYPCELRLLLSLADYSVGARQGGILRVVEHREFFGSEFAEVRLYVLYSDKVEDRLPVTDANKHNVAQMLQLGLLEHSDYGSAGRSYVITPKGEAVVERALALNSTANTHEPNTVNTTDGTTERGTPEIPTVPKTK